MTIYEWLKQVAEVHLAEHITLNLEQRSLSFSDILVIDHGHSPFLKATQADGSAPAFTGFIDPVDNPYAEIERLYEQYKRSVPSKRENLSRGYFSALSSDQLSFAELENNMPRAEARLLLEGFIVLGACAGIIPWHSPKHFFWRGTDPDLIVYRNWIIEEENQ